MRVTISGQCTIAMSSTYHVHANLLRECRVEICGVREMSELQHVRVPSKLPARKATSLDWTPSESAKACVTTGSLTVTVTTCIRIEVVHGPTLRKE